jgi:sugar phosphate isomerase/epimerase
MRLAVSNIGWAVEADERMALRLKAAGVDGVELAPSKYFGDLAAVERGRVDALRAAWEARGLPVVATQSLWFGQPSLKVFGSADERRRSQDYLVAALRVGAWLGAHAQVFGSPKNRLRGALPMDEALDSAAEFFRPVAVAAAELGTCLAFEPNPTAYGCDFCVRSDEGAELVRRVGHPAFRLHLDAAGMLLGGDDGVACARRLGSQLVHFHVSAPELAPVTATAGPDYRGLLDALRGAGYTGWASIEMRQAGEDGVEAVAAAAELIAPLAHA